jgi:hypothetical protein
MPSETAPAIDVEGEFRRTIRDVGLLIEFLGQQADSRLQAHFEDTRGHLSSPVRTLGVPPCRTYRHFLNRLVAIGGPLPGLPVEGTTAPTPPHSAHEGDEGLNDIAFLYFSRDFLAAVAAPATVETICVTRAYKAARRHSLLSHFRSGLRRNKSRAESARTSPPAPSSDECTASARRLAFRVIGIEYGAILLTLVTLAISAYALAGRTILDSQRQILADYAAIGHDREVLASDTSAASFGSVSPASTASLCDPASSRPRAALKDAAFPMQLDPPANGALAAPAPDPSRLAIMNLHGCSLYWRTKQNNEDIVAVTLHLVSWTRVVIGLPNIGTVLGVSQAFIHESADMHSEWCKRLGFERDSDGHCGPALQDLIYHTREVADSLLQCIALYVLPTLYGCLGAAAATLRNLRRKVDLSLVTVTDRGRVQQDIILGVLCGAIIGLFFGYIAKTGPGGGLGLSALALLAGYNVSGVFAFLDELSNRLFQPALAGRTDSRTG